MLACRRFPSAFLRCGPLHPMLAFRPFPLAFLRCGPRRNFFPFLGPRSLFEELDHGYSVGPHVSVKDTKDHVALQFEVPWFKADELKVSTRDGTLTVSGKKAKDVDAEHRHHLYGDASASTFARTFAVPRGLNLSQMKTELDHGVFTVTIPKVQPETATKPTSEMNTESKSRGQTSESTEAAKSQDSAESNTTVKVGSQEQPSEATKQADAALKVESNSSSTELIQNLSRMSWPPKVQVSDTASEVKYTVSLPEGLTRENLDLQLHGRDLDISVKHTHRVVKKDERGQVVSSEQQSLSYSTPVVVPEGTRASDISTSLEAGTLSITVTKQGNAKQAVEVN